MKTKPSTGYALLGAVMSGPKHGYEIIQFLNRALGPSWHVSTSQLYTLLKRLERDGLLCSTMELQDTRPSKRVFSLTPAGKKAFLQWQFSPLERVRDLRIEFLAKLFFFHTLSMEGGDELIEAQIQVLGEIRAKIKKRELTEKDPFIKLVFGFKIATLEAWLHWLIKEAKPFIGKDPTPGRSLLMTEDI